MVASWILNYLRRIKFMKFSACITNLNNFTLIFRTIINSFAYIYLLF